jgi:acetyltransferase-like isoleucine patch superfamily enzyme
MRRPRFLARFGMAAKIWNIVQYPNIEIGVGVDFRVTGSFHYKDGCSLGEGSNLIVPAGTLLQLGENCYVGRYVELGPRPVIRVGSGTSIQDRSTILGDVAIGRHCKFAPNIYLSSGKHHFDLKPSWLIGDQDAYVAHNEELRKEHNKRIVIEDDCWLGINVVILAGVTIHRGAIIGANSVVVRDVAPYSVVAGLPAKEITRRLDFRPPKSLNSDDEQSRPYFYSGFDLSQSSYPSSQLFGGLQTQGDFVLALQVEPGESVHLIVKCIDKVAGELLVNDRRFSVSNRFEEIVIRNGQSRNFVDRIRVQPVPDDLRVVVKKAWSQ